MATSSPTATPGVNLPVATAAALQAPPPTEVIIGEARSSRQVSKIVVSSVVGGAGVAVVALAFLYAPTKAMLISFGILGAGTS